MNSVPGEATIKTVIRSGLEEPVRALLECGHGLITYGKNDRSILHYVVAFGNVDQFEIVAESTGRQRLRD